MNYDGSNVWRNSQGQQHRIDGPARIWANGTQWWYHNGQLRRTDGPAVIDADGTQARFRNGQHHRTDGPAVIYADGSQRWYVNHQDITSEVEAWMLSQDVTWPWDSSTQTLFVLTFGV